MKILDVSHWQEQSVEIDWVKVKKAGYDAVIMKCTQGVSMLDKKFAGNKAEARAAGLLCGFYHFADGGNAMSEANWFMANIGDLQEGELLVLDWEIEHSDPAGWSRQWLDHVSEKMGFKPLLYTNEARVKAIDWKVVSTSNYGLWVAKYGDNDDIPETNETPNTDEWAFYAMWQFTSRGKVPGIVGNVDISTTTMDIKTLKKYGKPKSEEVDYRKLYETEKSKVADLEKKIEQIKSIVK